MHEATSSVRICTLAIQSAFNSSFHPGCSEGPKALWRTLFNGASNLTTERGVDLGARDDWSELQTVEVAPGEAGFEVIRRAAAGRLEQGLRLLSLGGDHSISYPILDAYAEAYDDLTVIQFDAHPDLYEDFDDNPYSHASPFARVLEQGRIRRLVQVGVRASNRHQREQAQRFGVQTFEAWRWREVLDIVFEPPIYVSLDLDVFDPGFAPGVAHHEPGGLTPRDVFDTLQRLPGLVGADVVELNPTRDHAGMTAALAAKCAKELLAQLAK